MGSGIVIPWGRMTHENLLEIFRDNERYIEYPDDRPEDLKKIKARPPLDLKKIPDFPLEEPPF